MLKVFLGLTVALFFSFGFVSGGDATATEVRVETANEGAMSVALLEAHYAECMKKFDGYAQSTRACVGTSFDEQDAYLNKLWADIKAKLERREENPEAFATLLEAQRQWLSYRDASCRFYYDMDGTIWRMLARDCRFNVVQGRLKVLEHFYTSLLDMDL